MNLASRGVCGKFVEGSGGDGKDEYSFTERGRPSQMAGPTRKVRTQQANLNTGWSNCVDQKLIRGKSGGDGSAVTTSIILVSSRRGIRAC